MGEKHIPVLLNEVLDTINCKKDGIYVDATVGSGGHAEHLLKKYPLIGMLVGIDRDEEALNRTKKKLQPLSHKVMLIHGNFSDIATILPKNEIHSIDGILFDFGVSTPQLKDPLRGFSFDLEGPLDMRMDRNNPQKAQDLIMQLSEQELAKVIRDYGQERWARRISRVIKSRLQEKPIENTTELSKIVGNAIPRRYHPKKIHPATKTFQALRIAVNNELSSIDRGLDGAFGLLKEGGRICAISFHSLEDGIVKKKFNEWAKDCICPPGIPFCACKKRKQLNVITKKPVSPSHEEITNNPKSRSAKLRAGEKL